MTPVVASRAHLRLPLSLPSASRPYDVLCLGENSHDIVAVVDALPSPGTKAALEMLAELPGGEAASAAVGLARLGWRVCYVGRFGDDDAGIAGRQCLEAEGVATRAITVPGARSRTAVILVERRTGQRTVLWSRDARLALVPQDVREADLAGCRVLLVGSQDVETAAWAAHRARATGTRTVGDLDYCEPGVERLLAALDIVIVSTAFAARFTGEREVGRALTRLADAAPASLWCVTLGTEGCIARVGSHTVRVPAFRVPVVDTTGAGDLFRAGFVAAWLRDPDQPDVEGLLRYANAVAALNCRGLGARAAAPRPHEVDTLLGEQAV